MYENMNCPLPDAQGYLDRMGLSEAPPVSLDGLNALIYAHQTHVPFEDLNSAYLKTPVPLDIPTLYDKIVVRHRGGYCYELNALFTRLLIDLGFDARRVFCRVVRGRDFIPPCAHQAIVVALEGQLWFCDVGYGGPMPSGALMIGDGCRADIRGEVFRIDRYDENWWTVSRDTSAGAVEKLIQFNVFPQHPQEFLAANFKAATDPESIFTWRVMVNLRTEAGSLSIDDKTFTRRRNGQVEVIPIADDAHLRRILSEVFNIPAEP